jgi:uncharacterized RDD family membrane protein YckC
LQLQNLIMSSFDILTSQNVSVNYNVAGVGNRIAATAIDYVFLGIYMLLISVVVQVNLKITNLFVVALLYAPVVFYQLLMEIFFNGQSVGKMMMNIRVMKTDGTTPSVTAYLLRWMFRLVDITFSMGSVAVLLIAFSEKAQRLGDLTAGTTVIRLKAKTHLRELVPVLRNETYQPVYSEVIGLTDQDIRLVKQVLYKQRVSIDTRLAQKMAAHVKKVTGITADTDDNQFLKTILLDYEYYSIQDRHVP